MSRRPAPGSPLTEPVPVPLLDVVLVVDRSSPSLLVWETLLGEFEALLGRVGFANVRLRYLDCPADGDAGNEARPVVVGGGADALTGGPDLLVDPTGRRIFMVLTDGLGLVWRSGAAERALTSWCRTGPVAVVHLLPRHRWHRTGVAPRRVRLRAPGPVPPNSTLKIEFPEIWQDPFAPDPDDSAVAVPVLAFEARSLGWWARMVTGDSPGWLDASILSVGGSGQTPSDDVDDDDDDDDESTSEHAPGWDAVEHDADKPDAKELAHDRVMRFRSDASPAAYRLATHLAAAPLDPRFIRLLQRLFVPEAGPGHLAEILLSGLVRHANLPIDGRAASPVPLEFSEGVREALLAAQTRAETARVLYMVSEYYTGRTGSTSSLKDALAAPDTAPDSSVTVQTLPLARAELAVMRALSGPYAGRARRLGRTLAAFQRSLSAADARQAVGLDTRAQPRAEPPQTPPSPDINDHPDTVGSTMVDATAQPRHATDTRSEEPVAATTRQVSSPAATLSGEKASHARDGVPSSSSDATSPPIRGEHRQATAVPPVWGNVPPKNPNFTGRADLLTQVRDRLRRGATAAVLPHALHGMGGVGKSQIAVEYVYRHQDEYDVIWWIPAERPTQIRPPWSSSPSRLNLRVGTEANTRRARGARGAAEGRPYRRWLLIFDNAEEPGGASGPTCPPGAPATSSSPPATRSGTASLAPWRWMSSAETRARSCCAAVARNSPTPRPTGSPTPSVTCRSRWSRRPPGGRRPGCRRRNTCGCSRTSALNC